MIERLRRELDRFITGNYGHDQFKDDIEPDPANDGPECEIIKKVLARHPGYRPGAELREIN